MSTELEEKIRSSVVNGKLPCPIAFKIAKQMKVNVLEVGQTADRIGIRIAGCQLGCFP